VLQSNPSGVHWLSEAHGGRQWLPTHDKPASQSALVTQSTQRPRATSHTWDAVQSSEFSQASNGTQVLAIQSAASSQSAGTTH
jgi:hypothetical protein